MCSLVLPAHTSVQLCLSLYTALFDNSSFTRHRLSILIKYSSKKTPDFYQFRARGLWHRMHTFHTRVHVQVHMYHLVCILSNAHTLTYVYTYRFFPLFLFLFFFLLLFFLICHSLVIVTVTVTVVSYFIAISESQQLYLSGPPGRLRRLKNWNCSSSFEFLILCAHDRDRQENWLRDWILLRSKGDDQ